MLDTRPTLVIAFTLIPGGTRGTRHTLTNAYQRGIPVVIVTPDGHIATHTPPKPAGGATGSHSEAFNEHVAPLPAATTTPTWRAAVRAQRMSSRERSRSRNPSVSGVGGDEPQQPAPVQRHKLLRVCRRQCRGHNRELVHTSSATTGAHRQERER